MHPILFAAGIVIGGLLVYMIMHAAMLKKAETEISAEIQKLRSDYAAARTKIVATADAAKAAPATMSAKLVETESKL